MSRSAAIKLIQPSALSSADEDLRTLQQRFEREAQSMASLNSINTVRVYDYGLSADQRLYYVMEHLDGIDLDELVARHGPQPLGRTCAILRQLANSLAEAHDQGLIHRDMKPANAFLCRQADDLDIVKVLDFGMVRHVDDSNDKRLTMQNTVIGTPAFMSPEQAQGEPELTTDVDIYALGCIAFWLLTGKVLFDRKTPMEVLMAHVSDPVPDIETVADRELPLPLIELIHDCLEKHPARRPDARSVRQVVTDIEAACDDWSPCLRAEWWHDKKPLPAGGSDPQIILNCDSSAPVMTCRKQLSSNG